MDVELLEEDVLFTIVLTTIGNFVSAGESLIGNRFTSSFIVKLG